MKIKNLLLGLGIVIILMVGIVQYTATLKEDRANIEVSIFKDYSIDYFKNIVKTDDEGYLVTGATNIYEGEKLNDFHSNSFIVKFDKDMNEEWSKTYESEFSHIYDVTKLSDGNFILVGDKDNRPIIAKIDKKGNILFRQETTLLRHSYYNSIISSVTATTDGGFVLSSAFYFDIIEKQFIKYDSSGNEVWNSSINSYSEGFLLHFLNIIQVKNGYVAIGKIYNRNQNGYVVKLDKNGEEEWFKKVTMNPTDLIQTNDGNVVIVGMETMKQEDKSGLLRRHTTYHSSTYGTIEKINSQNGDSIWSNKFGGGSELEFQFQSLAEDENSNLIVTGRMSHESLDDIKKTDVENYLLSDSSLNPSSQTILVKYDSSGGKIWESKTNQNVAVSLLIDHDDILTVGYNYPDTPKNGRFYQIMLENFDASYIKINQQDIPKLNIDTYDEDAIVKYNNWIEVRRVLLYVGILGFILYGIGYFVLHEIIQAKMVLTSRTKLKYLLEQDKYRLLKSKINNRFNYVTDDHQVVFKYTQFSFFVIVIDYSKNVKKLLKKFN
ncbi:hypothetical protein [Haloplasma contractile]|uniref:Lipoprotein putative n=1 Tax=Haloplasma contractile SSD-17B TaxID=1033810 RepID=F7Q0C3_9MOLU|nr:hypothetical protein [Haloplasma contractile]ERJ12731.1 Lipoprotein putative [Haloplasma contractile SSD-17B]